MNKQELMENYTLEELAEMVVKLDIANGISSKHICKLENKIRDLEKERTNYNQSEIEKYRYEAEKYQKAFEEAKKERDCQIFEFHNEIDRLSNLTIADFLPVEPIKVADALISAEKDYSEELFGMADTCRIFDISELRQIAQHLLIYCDGNEGEE